MRIQYQNFNADRNTAGNSGLKWFIISIAATVFTVLGYLRFYGRLIHTTQLNSTQLNCRNCGRQWV